MGRSPREKPKKLAAKMLKIRRRLGFSQTQATNNHGSERKPKQKRTHSMVGYAIYKKGLPGPVGILRYDQPLDKELLNGLIEHLEETYNTELHVRLIRNAAQIEELERQITNES